MGRTRISWKNGLKIPEDFVDTVGPVANLCARQWKFLVSPKMLLPSKHPQRTQTALHRMNYLRRVFSTRTSLLAAAIALAWTPRLANAQIGPAGPGNNYYPQTDAPINGNAALEFIESLLHEQYVKVKNTTGTPAPTHAGQTVYYVRVPSLYLPLSATAPALPPLPGDDNKSDFASAADYYAIASDVEIDFALGAAVQKILDGTAATAAVPYTGSLADLVSSVANYRKKAIKAMIKTATTNILNWGGYANEAARTADLETVAQSAIEANPAVAADVVATMLPLIVPKVASATPLTPVPLGGAQLTRTPSTTLTAADVKTALNALPGVMSKGGVTTTTEGGGIRVHFGSTSTLIPNLATASDFQNALNDPAFGLFQYAQFTVATDTANLIGDFQNDFVIAYKPINLNLAGATKWSLTPGFSDASDEVFQKAMDAAAENAAKIVEKAIGVVMQGVDVSGNSANPPSVNGTLAIAQNRGRQVAAIALVTAYNLGKGYLADEVGIAIGKKVKATFYQHKASDPLNKKNAILTSTDIVDAIFNTVGAPTDVKEVALIAAGLMKGFNGSKFEGVVDPTYVQADPDLPEVNIVAEINATLTLSGPDQTYLDHVRQGFQAAYAAALPTNANSVAGAIYAGLAGNEDQIAARLVGGGAWLATALTAKINGVVPFVKGSLLADVLQFDADQSGDDTIAEIMEAVVRASSKDASKFTEAAAGWSKNATTTGTLETLRFGQITEGTALGLKGQPLYNSMFNTAVGKIMTAAPLTKVLHTITNKDDNPMEPLLKSSIKLTELNAAGETQLKEIMSHAVSGALAAGHSTAPAGVAFTLAKAAKGFYRFYEPILEGAIDPAAGGAGALPDAEQWRAILGVMAVNKLSTTQEFDGTYGVDGVSGKPIGNYQPLYALIPARIQGTGVFDTMSGGPGPITNYNAALNDDALLHGGDVIKDLQDFPKAVFNKAYEAFADGSVVGDLTLTNAVLTGVGLVSSKNVSLAASLAVKFRPADATTFESEATGLNPSLAANVKLAVSTASHVAAGTGDLFDYLNNQIFQNSKYLVDIVTAATVVAPNYAHIIAHAVGFTAPKDVSKTIPSIFNYAHITTADTAVQAPLASEYDNPVDAAAAVAAAVTAGIVEAKTRIDFTALRKTNGTAAPTTKSQGVEITNLKNAVTAMVKQTLTLTGNTPPTSQWLPGTNADLSSRLTSGGDTLVGGGEGENNFLTADGNPPSLGVGLFSDIFDGGFTLAKQVGPAAIVSGFMSQVIAPTDTGLPLGNPPFASGDLGPVGQVVGAAIAVVKSDVSKVLAIAQAAAQAARAVSSTFSTIGAGQVFGSAPANGDGEKDVVLAVLNAFTKKVSGISFHITQVGHPEYVGNPLLASGKPNPYYQLDQKVAHSVHFGVLAAANNVPAAGAAGIVNFTHHTLTGAPVTDIFGL